MSALQGRAPRGSEAEHGAQAGEPLLHAVSFSQTYTDVSLRFFPLIVAIILHYIISIKEKASDRINQPFSNYIYLFGLRSLIFSATVPPFSPVVCNIQELFSVLSSLAIEPC